MISLLYRDWTLVKKTRAAFFGLFYLFLIVQNKADSLMVNYSTSFAFIFISYLFFSYLTAYDYKYNGLTFTAAFPVSKKAMVVSRYVFMAAIFTVFMIALIIIRAGVFYFRGMEYNLDLLQTGIYILIFSLFYSIIIPLYYKLGYQKIRWVMFIAMFAAAILSGILQQSGLALDTPVFLVASLIVGAIMYVISIEVSCMVLERTDL